MALQGLSTLNSEILGARFAKVAFHDIIIMEYGEC